MASLAALESLLQYLQSRFPHLAVEYFPEKPDDYRLNHPHGALLLSYGGSKYAPSADTAIVTQEEAISFAVTVVMRRLNGRDGAVDVADQVGRALLGFHPVDCAQVWLSAARFLGQQAGLWQYQVEGTTLTWVVEDSDGDSGPRLKHITVDSPYGVHETVLNDDGSVTQTDLPT